AFNPVYVNSNGYAIGLMQSDSNSILIYGYFNSIGGKHINAIAKLDLSGNLVHTFLSPLPLNSVVNSVYELTKDRFLLAGDFKNQYQNIILIDSDGAVDTKFLLEPSEKSKVRAMTFLPDSTIFYSTYEEGNTSRLVK